MKFILGKKLRMSQIFAEDGTVIPVTVVEAGPCQITQVRVLKKDGYSAVQVGYDLKKKLNKALGGHLKDLPKFRYLSEFRINPSTSSHSGLTFRPRAPLHEGRGSREQGRVGASGPRTAGSSLRFERGDEIVVSVFEAGDKINVIGVSKGKGFQGVVKRHGFHGSPASHGHKDQLRMPGSIGATAPARVFPGMRMPGRMGGEQVTVTNLEIVKIDKDKNLLYIKGAVPGNKNGLLEISGDGEMQVNVGNAGDAGDVGGAGNVGDVEKVNKVNKVVNKDEVSENHKDRELKIESEKEEKKDKS